MILIIGGAYQGKLDFAKEAFGITDSDVHICDAGEIDFFNRCSNPQKIRLTCVASRLKYWESLPVRCRHALFSAPMGTTPQKMSCKIRMLSCQASRWAWKYLMGSGWL